MFSRPVRSCWNPAPSSSRPASLPRTATSPSVGWRTPQMHLSRVDLPEPLRPRMPTVSPSRTVSETSRRAQKSSVDFRRPPWISRSLTVLYWPWAKRKRLETLRTSTAKSLIGSELFGEVALEATENGEGDQEQDQREEQHGQVEADVPQHALLGKHEELGHHAVHLGVRGRVRVDAALERQHQRHHGVEEVDPGQALRPQLLPDVLLVGVDDRAGPEPRRK